MILSKWKSKLICEICGDEGLDIPRFGISIVGQPRASKVEYICRKCGHKWEC